MTTGFHLRNLFSLFYRPQVGLVKKKIVCRPKLASRTYTLNIQFLMLFSQSRAVGSKISLMYSTKFDI